METAHPVDVGLVRVIAEAVGVQCGNEVGTRSGVTEDGCLRLSDLRLASDQVPESVYQKPGSRFVAEFLGRCNFITGDVEPLGAGAYVLRTPNMPTGITLRADSPPPAGPVTVAIRPEDIHLADDVNSAAWQADITHVTFLGENYLYTLTIGTHVLIGLSSRRFTSPTVRLSIPENAASILREPLLT